MSIRRRLCVLLAALGLLSSIPATALAATGSYWSVGGTYGVNVEYLGTNYPETLVLTQAGTGTITGASLGAPCTPQCANFTITSGSVVGDAITIVATSPFTLTLTGLIAADGTMTGTWADGAGGSSRTGTWATTTGNAALLTAPSHQKVDVLTQITPGVNGPAVGAVIFNSSAGDPNNLELTLQLKNVTPDTTYDVYLFLDTWASGQGIVVGTLTTNGVGNGTFHVNTQVNPGIHSVAIDVTLHGSSADLYVTEGLYGLNQFLFFK
ncbi:MAG: hypothetical protein HY262_01720 [Chloroflexi bacterium]|nr:hypothetical protein [Chloroflexota bacterium]